MEKIELSIHYDQQGNATVSVVSPEGITATLVVSHHLPPIERDNRINAFKAEQQALLEAG